MCGVRYSILLGREPEEGGLLFRFRVVAVVRTLLRLQRFMNFVPGPSF